ADRVAQRQAAEAKRAEELRVRDAARAEREAAKARRADERRQPPAAETIPAPAPTPADEPVTVPAGEAA
ncbi:MAG: hypothetical protein WEB13_01290, partial [Dehalococcoidia bacterium]